MAAVDIVRRSNREDGAALWRALADGSRSLPLPADLEPPIRRGETMGSRSLRCERLLRIVPGKRAVVAGAFAGQPVAVKLFDASAVRQRRREQAGYNRLSDAGIATPALLAASDAGQARHLMIYAWLPDAEPLLDMGRPPDPDRFHELLDLTARLYRAGLYQRDLHGGNFLWSNGSAWCIDVADIDGTSGQPVPRGTALDNLALLIAQFRRSDQTAALALVVAHPLAREYDLTAAELRRATDRRWQKRKHAALAKCFRDTTAVLFRRASDRVYACERSRAGPELEAFFGDPDGVMRQGEMLKDGNSATVVKVTLDGRPVVIKRYNIKGPVHLLRRFWRPSRAWISWGNAHRLQLMGIKTPPPVAFLERRLGPWRGRAYYLCDFVAGEELFGAFQRRHPSAAELQALRNYFALAADGHLVHGDMKATNLFVADESVWLLDLDAMREIASTPRWRRLYRKDIDRFLRNWPAAPWLDALRLDLGRYAGTA